jgi:rod shape-determining protein MreD
MIRLRQAQFGRAQTSFEFQLVPVLSTLAGSLTPLLPQISTATVLPPFGLLMLLAWRLHRRELWSVWAPLPLGFFDDIFSGQPLGSAMLLWTLAFLMLDMLDRRMVWRDQKQDWVLAAGLIMAILIGGALVAGMKSTSILYILPQIAMTVMLFPMAARFVAALDRWRLVR